MKARARKRLAETLSGLLGTDAGVIESRLLAAFHQARQEAEAQAQAVREAEALLDSIEVEPPPGPELLREIEALLRKYIILPEGASLIIALWAVHTHIFEVFNRALRLFIVSPEKDCGKTNLLTLISYLSRNPFHVGDVSVAILARRVHRLHPTVFIDEASKLWGNSELAEAVRYVLRYGYRPGWPYARLERRGDVWEEVEYDTFCPVALAQTGEIGDDHVVIRGFTIRMKRKTRNEHVEDFLEDVVEEEALPIRQAIQVWAACYRNAIGETYRAIRKAKLAPGLEGKMVGNFNILAAILHHLDPGRINELRRIAVAMAGQYTEDALSIGERLLRDIRDIFRARAVDHISTQDLLLDLNERPEWSGWNGGKGLRADQLARMLKPFGIRPAVLRLTSENKSENKTVRGYRQADFTDAWNRYLDREPEPDPEPLDFLGLGVEGVDPHDTRTPEGGVTGVTAATEADFRPPQESAPDAAVTGVGSGPVTTAPEAESRPGPESAPDAVVTPVTSVTPPNGGQTQIPLIPEVGRTVGETTVKSTELLTRVEGDPASQSPPYDAGEPGKGSDVPGQ
jgi:hypothetical protein